MHSHRNNDTQQSTRVRVTRKREETKKEETKEREESALYFLSTVSHLLCYCFHYSTSFLVIDSDTFRHSILFHTKT